MCFIIYISLIGLLLIYSDSLLEHYALSERVHEADWMVVALNWEIIPQLWPLFLLGMAVASFFTVLVLRLLNRRKQPQTT